MFSIWTAIPEDFFKWCNSCGQQLSQDGILRVSCMSHVRISAKSYAGRCTCDFKQFDLTCSDSDGIWTNSPWLQDDLTSHVRMLNDDSQGLDDIVLDSGADCQCTSFVLLRSRNRDSP